MSKPEDIPQDVWEAAFETIAVGYDNAYIHQEDIARAIMAAKAEEREACAALVEAFTPIRPAFVTEDEGGIKWPHPAEQQPIYQPGKLAAAIRKRGEV